MRPVQDFHVATSLTRVGIGLHLLPRHPCNGFDLWLQGKLDGDENVAQGDLFLKGAQGGANWMPLEDQSSHCIIRVPIAVRDGLPHLVFEGRHGKSKA